MALAVIMHGAVLPAQDRQQRVAPEDLAGAEQLHRGRHHQGLKLRCKHKCVVMDGGHGPGKGQALQTGILEGSNSDLLQALGQL